MRVTIITVCHNSQRYIDKTIESVLIQTHPDLEYVIVDGGSTDGTVEIIRRYAEADSRIIWRSEADRGIADAMNKGVSLATGEVVAHINSDDFYAHPLVVARMAEIFSNNAKVGWVSGGFNFVADDGTFIRKIRARRYSFRRLIRGNILLHPATFTRRTLFDKAGGFDLALRYCMDYDLFLRLGAITSPLMLDEQLACFRIHAASRSVSEAEQAYAEEFKVRMNYLKSNGRSTIYYQLDHQIKRHLNRLFYNGLLRSALDRR